MTPHILQDPRLGTSGTSLKHAAPFATYRGHIHFRGYFKLKLNGTIRNKWFKTNDTLAYLSVRGGHISEGGAICFRERPVQ